MRTAFEIGVLPHQFWRMTLRTFLLCFEGYMRRQRDDMRKRAWEVCHTVNLWATETVTPAELLGEAKPQPLFVTVEEWQAHMRKAMVEDQEVRRGA